MKKIFTNSARGADTTEAAIEEGRPKLDCFTLCNITNVTTSDVQSLNEHRINDEHLKYSSNTTYVPYFEQSATWNGQTDDPLSDLPNSRVHWPNSMHGDDTSMITTKEQTISILGHQTSNSVPNVSCETPYICHECGFLFQFQVQLDQHANSTNHSTFKCDECGEFFERSYQINNHIRATDHAAYKCLFADCQATFTRQDVMLRHQLGHAKNPVKYSCTHCKKWRSPNGFKRLDHLKQHLKNYHHIEDSSIDHFNGSGSEPKDPAFFLYCPHQKCPLFREVTNYDWGKRGAIQEEHLFKSRSDFTTHLRKEHDDSIYPCTVNGCKRIGGKGYFRKRDLKKHVTKAHPSVRSQDAGFEDGIEMMGENLAE